MATLLSDAPATSPGSEKDRLNANSNERGQYGS